jgi:hypothetical protein
VGPKVIMQIEGLDQIQNTVSLSVIKPVTFRPVAYCHNQLLYITVDKKSKTYFFIYYVMPGGRGSIPGTTRKKSSGVWNGVHSAS